ncbi:MAG TPA: Maf family protein [Chloroflexota bacterium]|nr:Maf family protein [Chloroflexota bacterium]
MPKLILASQSPRRDALLKQIGLDFEVIPSNSTEDLLPGASPRDIAEALAMEKALSVASGLGDGIVIGADTVVVLEEEILGKPLDEEDARRMLSNLSGREHQVITGLAVVDAATGRSLGDSVVTDVQFAPLSPELIDRYVATGEPLDKAGAYAIQGHGALLVAGISGCYSNVVGLPLRRLAEMLHEFGYDAFKMERQGA